MLTKKTAADAAARPFVKWVGGKRQLLPYITGCLPVDFGSVKTVVEPFVGGGAVFFTLKQLYPDKRYVINDANRRLITTYRIIRDKPYELLERLTELQIKYYGQSSMELRKAMYLEVRERFNGSDLCDGETAALFIFLNRTGFNGLYRVNRSDRFNNSFGEYQKPLICDSLNIRKVSELLKRVKISCGDFQDTGRYAGPGTFYYFDPPYRPISNTASFTSYTRGGFGDREQAELAGFCRRLTAAGSRWMQSNSDGMNRTPPDPFFDDLYSDCKIRRIAAPRSISRTGEKNHRTTYYELLR